VSKRTNGTDAVRLGLVGLGNITRKYRQALADVAGIEVAALVDIDKRRTARASRLFPNAFAVDDFEQVVDKVDAAVILLPHHLHHASTKAFLGAGKHVLLEKPIANTEADCLDLIETAEASGATLMIGYSMRYDPFVVRVRELLQSGELGTPFQTSIWTEQLDVYEPTYWKSRKDQLGGGQFFSHGCHYVDLLLWYLGAPVRGCHMSTRTGSEWMEGEGTSNVVIEFEGGKLAYHFGTWGARGTKLDYAMHVHCEGGMLEYDMQPGKLWLHRGGVTPPGPMRPAEVSIGVPKRASRTLLMSEQPDRVAAELRHFIDCVRSGSTPLTDGRTSLQSLRVIWKLYEAERTGAMADLRGLGLT
jgi:predicted dehydrogenase